MITEMKSAKRGRPPKPGPRYDCGQRKPAAAIMSPALWQRIKTEGIRLALDPKLGTEVGKLSLSGELTNAQTAAAFRVAEIYGRYERFKRRRRSAASPSYNAGFGDPDVDEGRLDAEQLAELEECIRDAERQFALIQNQLPAYPPGAASLMERLCVENESVTERQLETIRVILDRIIVAFGENWRKRKGGPADMRRLGALRTNTKTNGAAAIAPTPRRDSPSKTAWLLTIKKLRPDLDDDELQRVYDIQLALTDREQFRRSKA